LVLVVPDSEAGGGWQFGAFILKDSEIDMKVDEEAKGYMWLAAEEAKGLIYSRIWQEKIMGLILSTIVTNYSSQDSLYFENPDQTFRGVLNLVVLQVSDSPSG
jgi:hypothetical protein